MTDSPPHALLSSPATVAAARIVQDRLAAATATALRLGDRGDRAVLHDFRVAVRRLRSALRSYRPLLGRAASRKVRSRLRELGRATNRGRDAEVQADWVASDARSLPEAARAGAAVLAARLRKRATVRPGELQRDFTTIADKILKRLEFLDHTAAGFAAVFAALLAQHADDAASCIAAVVSADQVEEAHAARIAVKRLRYLLEPVADEIPGSHPLLVRVETLQDLLGELHDSHVLDATLDGVTTSRRIPQATLAALAAENGKRRRAVFTDLQAFSRSAAASAVLFEQIRTLVI